jgi:integrase
MSKMLRKVKDVYENAYDLKTHKKLYSGPTIQDYNGDLSKRWYVYYSFRNPDTDKLERQTPIDTGVNQHKNLHDRNKAIHTLLKTIEGILENGFNPFTVDGIFESEEDQKMTVIEALDFALTIGKQVRSETSWYTFKSRVTQFKSWLLNNGYKNRHITAVTEKTVQKYLNGILKRSSPANRNNAKAEISAAFTFLKDNYIIPVNFIKEMNVLKSSPERHKTYSSAMETDLYNYMHENDKLLLLFVKFICYNFLRPIEVCRIRVEDIDLTDRTIKLKAKNKVVKVKYMPDILVKDLATLEMYESKDLLFTPKGPGKWKAKESSRREHFSARFRVVKEKFKLGEDYGIYSFRHTFITKLYNELIKTMTPDEALNKMLLITGHATMGALKKYLRDTDTFKPNDWSEYIK